MSQKLIGSSTLPKPLVSVIIPTYNRQASLALTLASLVTQTYPADRFEVVVGDDGGSDDMSKVIQTIYPFNFLYLRQANQGSAAARNYGAQQASGEVLVFIDDDMTLQPDYLSAIARKTLPGVIAMGTWLPFELANPSWFSKINTRQTEAQAALMTCDQEVPFTECSSNNLAVQRADFNQIGMWRDVLGDGPTLWGDVEFGYRGREKGCRFVRVADARLIHRDQHANDLATAARRAYHVSKIVQPLFRLHPGIDKHLPMFRDKGPIEWREDSPTMIARKLARQVISSPLVVRGMEWLVHVLEVRHPSTAILERLYRWICSAYIYRGYRVGLQASRRRQSGN